MTPYLTRGTIVSFDPATYTALVMLDGSVAEVVMPVGEWVPANYLAADDQVAVLLFQATNYENGVILGPFGAVAAAPAFAGLNLGAATGAGTGTLYALHTGGVAATLERDGTTSEIALITHRDNGNGNRISARHDRGSKASPGQTLNNDQLLQIWAGGYQETTGAYVDAMARINLMAAENWTSTAQGTKIQFHTTPVGSASQSVAVTITADGALALHRGPLDLPDGITAPGTQAGFARLYVDSADGDLKVRFGDGTIKTIVTDT